MRLDRLLGDVQILEVLGRPGEVMVESVTHDSRLATEGSLFLCVPGGKCDGHDFAASAVTAGASALVCERVLSLPVPQIVVPSTRAAIGPISAAFFGTPSRQVTVAGVTGTNGKTTTCHFLQAALEAAGTSTKVIGTLTGRRTTPEATELQAQLADFRDRQVRAVAMEVSSHALDQHRVDGTWFSIAVFTNLSPEHLDYHGSMAAYFRAKASLFEPARCARAVVNSDDRYGRLLMDAASVPTEAFCLADAIDLELGPTSSSFSWRGHPVRLEVGGLFNVMNSLAAATAAVGLGASPAAIASGLSNAGAVPGRFEVVDAGQPFSVVVDYAHTPAGLEQVLRAARLVAGPGRVTVVFGCGGDRDKSKRPVMGALAARLADRAILTTDNPRHEDPMAVIADVRAGLADLAGPSEWAKLEVEPDRRAAIASALADARPGDVVVIAGKGHETTQVVGDRSVPFDDRLVARQELERTA